MTRVFQALANRKRFLLFSLTIAVSLGQILATLFSFDSWPLTNYPMFAIRQSSGDRNSIEGFEVWAEDSSGSKFFLEKNFNKMTFEIFRKGVHENKLDLIHSYLLAHWRATYATESSLLNVRSLWLVRLSISLGADNVVQTPEKTFITNVVVRTAE